MRRRFLFAAAIVLGAASVPLGTACSGGRTGLVVVPPDAGSDAPPVPEAGPPPIEQTDKVDLLLVVDNSPNTDNFQALFAATAPYLMGRFATPACVNGLGNVVATTAAPTDPCPIGQREFHPVTDLHVGVITTSLGGHGADSCSPSFPYWNPTQNDAAHFIDRAPDGGSVSTYQGEGFLAWDPAQRLSPPGLPDVGELSAGVADLTSGAGELGCGFEASLESIYRFLVDPEPYQSISVVNGQATPMGTDTALLQQRADFLRPDSALVIVLITDEDDCSVRDGSQYYYALQGLAPGSTTQLFHLPPPRSVCATNPDDPCCTSCAQTAPPGCLNPDPACAGGTLDGLQDPLALRCFDEKRRFGVDFLYPVQRYVDGLTNPMIQARDGTMVPNPLYTGNRSPDLVMMAGILGVPWQDIAKYPKSLAEGYAPAGEIDWSLLLPAADGGPPADPLMLKSIDPRTGSNPPTGDALAPPSAGLLANPINGHERTIPNRDDLQYACIYTRLTPVECVSGACNCDTPADIATNPVCQAPDGTYSNAEYYTRALPSTRPLQVLQGLGDRATVASICAEVTSGPDTPTFAYKPAVDAILRTLRPRLF